MNLKRLVPLFLLCVLMPARAADTEQWATFELTASGPSGGNPYLEVRWSATFTQGSRSFTVPGFWDGGDTYKIRFSPPTIGKWQYKTQSAAPGLDGKTGSFTATAPGGNNHGPIEVFSKHYLRYADGSPYHQFGTTCYVWNHQPQELQQQTLRTLASAPFNKIRFCVFPKSYTYNQNEPELFPFRKTASGKFDFTSPDPVFWRLLEKQIVDLQKLGIEADLILWHPYDRWGFAEMGRENDDRYLRYAIARLSAFRNVWWSLANEYDLMAPGAMAGHRGDKQMSDWDRFFQILQQEDPHQRLRGIHNCRGFYDHTRPWVTHVSVQHGDLVRVLEWRNQYGKPVVVDECGYEGNIPQGWGRLSAQEMVRRFWIGTMTGGYVGHGETYRHPQDILWWSKGGVLHGESPARIQWLKNLVAQSPAFHQLEPRRHEGTLLLAKPAEFYLLYALNAQPQKVQLEGDRPYKIDAIDPWGMAVYPLGSAQPGNFSIPSAKAHFAYRFTPYQPGEKLRPEARINASVSEGIAPLAVKFSAAGGQNTHWDFGDGTTSGESNPAHVFKEPGLYLVTLQITDEHGGSARTFVEIAVDRNTTDPIVRAGFADGDKPGLKLQGTARRGEKGSLHLPEGAPWGWVQAGDGALDDLRRLRSFTITGWLKPESLQMGSGGNRIVFCLNVDHSGFDLVCHSDGRMRLAVNQWPDGIANDSSPGKLQAGKWTRFAVSYDGTSSKNNVSWYFSAPRETPESAELLLDRKTTYAAGPVGVDIGSLVIGNFNETMRNYGLDRQFRGQIRDLQIFGSRAGGHGALTLEKIRQQIP
jgi:PKD repeat protein